MYGVEPKTLWSPLDNLIATELHPSLFFLPLSKKMIKSICMSTKDLFKEREELWGVTQQFLQTQEKAHACAYFGEI